MSNYEQIIEFLADMLWEMKGFREELKEMKQEIIGLKEQQAKTNLAIGELRLSVMRLAEDSIFVRDHERRLNLLEQKAFRSEQ